MHLSTRKWLRIAILNLSIVAFIGVILRYKIAYALPFVDQKHLLHGHSHFAFAGWITQALMTLMVAYLQHHGLKDSLKKYAWLLIANLITAYGMLLAFPVQGYGLFSILFSTLSIVVAYFFAFLFWKDLNKLPTGSNSHLWFKAAVVFNALSSIGAFSLAYMMVNHIINLNGHLLSIYYFLHFQYNGWFFFACMGLLIDKLNVLNIRDKSFRNIFFLFFFACVPAYFLSVLWLPLPLPAYVIVVFSAIAQVIAWIWMLNILAKNKSILKAKISKTVKVLLGLSALALSVKLLLQLGSTYPPLSELSFGFRPIVIGYLHLILLGVITIFLIGYMMLNDFILMNSKTVAGISIFVGGIIYNEILLLIQGSAAMNYVSVPFTNELLLSAAIVMFSGVFVLLIGQFKRS